LSLAGSGANVHDVKLLEPTLDAIATPRPKPSAERPQHFGADAGYKGQAVLETVQARDYQPHIEQRKEEAEAKRTEPGWKPRRWWSNTPTPGSTVFGSTAFASCRSASRKPKPVILPCSA
jgi:hypothetical protein